MGIFNFRKKRNTQTDTNKQGKPTFECDILSANGLVNFVASNIENPTPQNIENAISLLTKPVNDLNHLTTDGELPWGWHTHTKDFTSKIQTKYSYFLNMWLDSRKQSPKEQCFALKSFINYLEDVEQLCKSKGECFEFWFYEILTSKDYIEKRKHDLCVLVENLDELQTDFEKRSSEIADLDSKIIALLIENDNILQTDFIKLFDPSVHKDVREKLYYMEKSNALDRTKCGRSYLLHYRKG